MEEQEQAIAVVVLRNSEGTLVPTLILACEDQDIPTMNAERHQATGTRVYEIPQYRQMQSSFRETHVIVPAVGELSNGRSAKIYCTEGEAAVL